MTDTQSTLTLELPMKKIYREAVPVDDGWHNVLMPVTDQEPIVHVAAREADLVEVWWVHDDTLPVSPRAFRVYGTGQPLDPNARHVGTAIIPSGRLVWHLMEAK